MNIVITLFTIRCSFICLNFDLVQAENISTVVKAAGVSVEPYWPGLFAKLFENKSMADLITNVGAGMLLLFVLFLIRIFHFSFLPSFLLTDITGLCIIHRVSKMNTEFGAKSFSAIVQSTGEFICVKVL